MPEFRKKPLFVEARQVPRDSSDIVDYLKQGLALAEWCKGTCYMMVEDDERAFEACLYVGPHILIDDPINEGAHAAFPGDWIIHGVQGEFYGCKPEIFDATYEKVEAV